MSHRRALLVRWSTRDRLAVIVVAVTVAFLAGTGLLAAAGADGPVRIAAEYGPAGTVEAYDSATAARSAAGEGDLILPIAAVLTPEGSSAVVVGVPPSDAAAFADRAGIRVTPPPASGVSVAGVGPDSPADVDGSLRLDGEAATVTVATSTRRAAGSVVPPDWLIAEPGLVERLGPTGAVVLSPASDEGTLQPGRTHLRGALAFFVAGAQGVARVLSVAAVGAGLLVLVTVFSVTRMTVRDRRRTIAVVRATGAPPRRVLRLFGLRAGLLAALGAALGLALGVVATNAASNVAVTMGVPTSLRPRVTAEVAVGFLGLLVGASALGGLAGVAAAWPAVRGPPMRPADDVPTSRRGGSNVSVIPGALRPAVLDARALVPTAATLAAFALLVLLGVSVGAAGSSVVAPGQATITEPGATHPIASAVPAAYADALREDGTPASAEILLFTVVDGHPVVARGAAFGPFASVSEARLESGRPPDGPGEAVVGVDLARTLGVEVGDRLLVGGSTQPGFAGVEVVGTYAAPGVFDDQLVVPLGTARHLSGRNGGSVHFVRLGDDPSADAPAPGAAVVAVDAPATAVANDSLTVEVTLHNPTPTERRLPVVARLLPADDAEPTSENRTTATLASGSTRTVRLRLATGAPGEYKIGVGDRTTAVSVASRDALRIRGLPDAVPVGSEPLVRVVDATGGPVPDAELSVRNRSADGNRSARTGPNGTARVRFDDAGVRLLVASVGERTARAEVRVSEDAHRRPVAGLAIEPGAPTVLTRPTARVTLENPWRVRLNGTVEIEGPNTSVTRTTSIPPGGRRELSAGLPRRPPGRYDVTVVAGGRQVAATTYRVGGDPRLAAALAGSRDGPSGSGIGQGIATVVGNLETLLVTVVALAGLMAAGAATATFAGSVHARRRDIGLRRATGATPRRVLGLVLRDALLVGGVATVVGVVAAFLLFRGLALAGFLTVYGVRLSPPASPTVLLGVAAGGLVLVVVAAGLAAVRLLSVEPIALLAPERTVDDRAVGGDRGG